MHYFLWKFLNAIHKFSFTHLFTPEHHLVTKPAKLMNVTERYNSEGNSSPQLPLHSERDNSKQLPLH